jgi:phosphoserine aminotransferase
MEKAQQEFADYHGIGYGIMEASHRGPDFSEVRDAAEANLRTLLGAGDDYAVMFLQGGASTQFFQVPMVMLAGGATADYADTGAWSAKAIKEAKSFGTVNVACSSKDANYTHIPAVSDWQFAESATYLHLTSNNTIFGTQYQELPVHPGGAPLVVDASSDILSRPVDISQYGILYAGAQKNLGPSGVTIVVARRDLLEPVRAVPTMMDYRTHDSKDSCFNTPPTFAIYMVRLVTDWLLEQGGLEAMAAVNTRKADRLYGVIDADDFYVGPAALADRSQMNVCFRTEDPELDAKFIAEAKNEGLVTLKGHRSVGGMRASIYNAIPEEGVERLAQFMEAFRSANG